MNPDRSAGPTTRPAAPRNLRIFIISYLYDPYVRQGMGGFQKVIELALEFSRRHHVTLFAPRYCRRVLDLNCVWVPVIDKPLLRPISFNLFLVAAILFKATRGLPHVMYERIFNAITPPLLARLLRCRFVVEFNGNPLQFYRDSRRRQREWLRRLIAWNLRSAHKIVALTEGLKSEIKKDFDWTAGERVFLAPSGSNPKLFFPRQREQCRQQLGISSDQKIGVFTGTFFDYQGIELVLQALADPALACLQVWLVGDGVMRAQWERQATNLGLTNVRFTGQVSYERVPLFVGAANVCLAPFHSQRGEVSPLKVIDYLFCGRPTVISRIPAVENLLDRFNSLAPFEPDQVASFIRVLLDVIESQEHFDARAQADALKAREEFSWERIARTIEDNCF